MYKKSSTGKLSIELIDEEAEKSLLNNINLLISEEKQPYVSLFKQIMILNGNLHKKVSMWRQQLELLTILKRRIKDFPIPEISLLFHEVLFDYAKDGIKPLQYISLEILASLILYNYDIEEAESIMKEVISEFAEADSSHWRCLFVDFFEICWSLPFTIANLEEKLFGHLIKISECSWEVQHNSFQLWK